MALTAAKNCSAGPSAGVDLTANVGLTAGVSLAADVGLAEGVGGAGSLMLKPNVDLSD